MRLEDQMSEPDPLNPGKYLGEFDPPPGHKYADFTPSDYTELAEGDIELELRLAVEDG